MPSGPEHFVPQPGYSKEFTRARELLLAHPGRWRVIYHYDGDGIASASAILRALERLGYTFQATPLVGVERPAMARLVEATRGPLLVVDTGATWLDLFAAHPHPVVVLDHHQYPGSPTPPELPRHVGFVNPLDWDVDGMRDLCAATLAWLYTVFLDPRNWDNAPWGLSGAIADRQHVGGFHGLNARLLDEATARSLVQRRHRLALGGGPLGAAIARSVDPYFRGLSGRPEEVRRLLASLGLDPGKPLAELERAEEQKLTSVLLNRLVQQGTRPEFCEVLTQESWWLPSLGLDAQELSNLQNAAGRAGEPSVGVALALGDRGALARAREHETAWRTGILDGLRRLEDGGVNARGALQWFESPETNLAGTQAGLAMNYLLDARRPVFSFSPGGDVLRVSARGTLWLVGQGLDLAVVCREAADAVHGEGGGHPVASGATIPASARDAFLDEADRRLAVQLAALLGGAAA